MNEGDTLEHKASVFVKACRKVTDSNEDTSLLDYRIYYRHKKFYDK
jgi:hypothetical protein